MAIALYIFENQYFIVIFRVNGLEMLISLIYAGGWTFAVYSHYDRGRFFNAHPKVFVSYRGGHNRVHGSHYAHMHKPAAPHHAPAVHHPAPAPHHAKAPVKVDKRHGITSHTLASNTPRYSRSNAGHFGRR